MAGLARLCRAYGRLTAQGADGRKVAWSWDYAAEKAVREEEMPEFGERWRESERAKWKKVKEEIDRG